MSFSEFSTIFIPVLGGVFFFFNTLLKEESSIDKLVDMFNRYNYFEFYRLRLKSALNRLDNYLGKPSWSWDFMGKNIAFHYGLAILYVFLVFLVVWLAGGNNSIGALEILPQKETLVQRVVVIIVLAVIGFVMYYGDSKKFEAIDKKIKQKFTSILPISWQPYSIWIQKALIGVIFFSFLYLYLKNSLSYSLLLSLVIPNIMDSLLFLIIVGAVVAAAAVGAGVGAGVGAAVAVEAVAGAGAGVGAGVVVEVIFLIGGIIGISSFIDTGLFLNSANTSMFIFLFLIPLLNAILDFVSLTLSRYFSQKIVEDRTIFLVFFHLLLDFVFAVLFLFLLGLCFITQLIFLIVWSIQNFKSLLHR